VPVAPTYPDGSVERLRAVPWDGLRGLAPSLGAPLAEVLAGAPAERVLDRFLRSRPDLDGAGRRAAAEAVFGVGLWRRRLRHHAGRDASPLQLLAALVRDLGGRPDAGELCGIGGAALPPPEPPPCGLAERYSLPDWLADTIVREVAAAAAALADALGTPGPVWLRANRLRTDRASLARRLEGEGVRVRPGRLAPDALEVVSPRPNLFPLPSFREGLFEVQDEGSQLLGELVGTVPGDEVLDLCAGAGGKALQLAAAGARRVHACDPDAARLDRLRARAARAGAGAAVAVHGPSAPEGLRVDRALVDAPCSGLGALRRGPDLRHRIDPATFEALPGLQLSLLARASRHVRPGGRLVYATCTFRREEDEAVAVAFERAHPGFERIPAAPAALATPEGFLRTWPHRDGTDGFFAAAWRRG
jgi:16S rRNA (cytosine967-C5)-methyltransferase